MILLNHILHPNLKKWTVNFSNFLFYCYHNSETSQITGSFKKFFKIHFYLHHSSETNQYLISFKKIFNYFSIFILTVKLCSLPYVCKNSSKKLFDIIFLLKLIITVKGCFTPYLSKSFLLFAVIITAKGNKNLYIWKFS